MLHFTLANGLTVVLLEDHALPKVVVDTWFGAGTRDEGPEEHGFARLFETRLAAARGPAELVQRVERGGGTLHASVDVDRARAVASGPAELLDDMLALEAERLAALGEPVTPEELALLRAEASAGGEARTRAREAEDLLYSALYPPSHPYHHALAATRVDLAPTDAEEATAFLHAHFVPGLATLVVAGDLEPRRTRAAVERRFGSLPARAAPELAPVPALERAAGLRLHAPTTGAQARLVLAWHSPPAFAPGDAELDLVAMLLAEGPWARLDQRLVLDLRLAQEVDASQRAAELGSLFVIDVLATPGADLARIRQEILAALDALAREGPDDGELARARERVAARFRLRLESLLARAEAVQAYLGAFGTPDAFERDLARRTGVTHASLQATLRAVLERGHVELQLVPTEGPPPGP